MFIRRQRYLQAVSEGHEEENSKNFTEHVTVVLFKVHCPTRSLGVGGGGHHPCQDADSGPLMGRTILQSIGSSFVSLACTKTVVSVVTLAPLLGSSASWPEPSPKVLSFGDLSARQNSSRKMFVP